MEDFGENVIKLNDTLIIDCGDCGTHLLKCICINSDNEKDNKMKSQFIVQCNRCNGKSFPSKVMVGRSHVFPFEESAKMHYIDTFVKDDIIISTLKIGN